MQVSVLPLGSLETNCCIVTDEATGATCVIDPAEEGERIAQTLEQLGLSLKLICLTHGHYDHVGGVQALHEATGAPVYLHAADLALPESLTAGPLFYTDTYDEGDTLPLGQLNIRVYHTPGHTPGSVCLHIGDQLFTGDTLFWQSCGRVDLPLGDWEAMLRSLRRLSELEGDLAFTPGHGNGSTLDAERKSNHYMREAQQ